MAKAIAGESYAESVREVVIVAAVEVASLDKLKELTLVHRQRHSLLRPDDFDPVGGSNTDKKWEGRVRSALMTLRRNGEAALIGRGKYRFFI